MTYFAKRDAYLAHVKTCTACVSSFTGKRKVFADERGVYVERYATCGNFCDEARKMLEELI